jgi:cardiolipin synthase
MDQHQINDHTAQELKNSQFSGLYSYNFNGLGQPVLVNNDVEIIKNNINLFQEYIELIRKAEHTIHLQTYIVRTGFFLNSVANELIKKAKAGVKVRFMYD